MNIIVLSKFNEMQIAKFIILFSEIFHIVSYFLMNKIFPETIGVYR